MFKKILDRSINCYLLLSLILIMLIGLVACNKKPIEDVSKPIKIPDNIITCKTGETIETINETQDFKATFTCLDDLKNHEYQHYKLNNGKILLLVDQSESINSPRNDYKGYIFDPKTELFTLINNKFLEENDFQYGSTKKLPKNKQFITDKLIFNSENNRLYEVPEDEYKKLQQFKKDSFAKFKYTEDNRLFTEKNTLVLYVSKRDRDSKNYTDVWLQDFVHLKNYKTGKFNYPKNQSCSALFIGNNRFILIGGFSNKVELYDANTGEIFYVGETKQLYNVPTLFLLNNNDLAICTENTIELFNFKKSFSSLYKYENKDLSPAWGKSFYSFSLLNEYYIFMYSYIYEHSVLFNLENKLFYDLNNLDKEGLNNNLYKNGLRIKFTLFNEKDSIEKNISKITELGSSKFLITGGALATSFMMYSHGVLYYYNSAELFNLKPLNQNINKELSDNK